MHERHGESKTRLYYIWRGMIDRCYNNKCANYSTYGGRGILICEEWRRSYTAFSSWAKANGYKSSLTIDRINNYKGYSPDNCRWATPKQQARNRRPETFALALTHDGKTKSLFAWSVEKRINYTTLVKRFKKGLRGDELFKPPRLYKDKVVQAFFDTRNGKAKLTNQEIEEIRASSESGAALARRLKVAESTISMIRSGQRRAG